MSEGEPFPRAWLKRPSEKLYKPSWTPWERSIFSNQLHQTNSSQQAYKAFFTYLPLPTSNQSQCSSSRPSLSSPSWPLASPPPLRVTLESSRSAGSAAPTMVLATPTARTSAATVATAVVLSGRSALATRRNKRFPLDTRMTVGGG